MLLFRMKSRFFIGLISLIGLIGAGETISVNYVLVPFTPLDKEGRPVRGVRERDVKVSVDGVPIRTDLFDETRDSPVSFTILLDGSGSMALAGKMDAARYAVRTLFANRLPGDDYSLHVFKEGTVVEAVPFTRDTRAILRAMDGLKPYGTTALFDAILKMPDKTILGQNGTRAIILLTDGLDNASETEQAVVAKALEGVDVAVYPVALGAAETAASTDESRIDVALLGNLARSSGGQMIIAANLAELQRSMRAVLDELRTQYLVGFAPTGRGAVKYRAIEIDVAGPVRYVRARGGYRGTEPPPLTTNPTQRRR